jgi:hypothetical protein
MSDNQFQIGDRVYTLEKISEIGIITDIDFRRKYPYQVKWPFTEVVTDADFLWSAEELNHAWNGLDRVLRELPE